VDAVLFIEYDVDERGEISLVALVNAEERNGEDPDGEAWMVWRRSHEDEGWGCAPVPPADLRAMESTEDPEALRAIVERVVVADRAAKEAAR
jgi:hypothetical protein